MKTTGNTLIASFLMISMISFSGYAQEAVGNVFADVIDLNNPQDISELPKMDRDIVILQNVLNDLFNKNRNQLYSSRRTKGIYIPNRGVIFSVHGNGIFYDNNYVTWDELVVVVDQNSQLIGKEYSDEELKKLNEEKEKKLTDLSKTFLANYGSLLGELKDNEKIQVVINYSLHVQSSSRKKAGQLAFVSSAKDINKRRLTAEVSVKDIRDYVSGQLNQTQIFSRINTQTIKINEGEMIDAKILAGIFDDLYKTTFNGLFGRSGGTSWTYFEGFGLMYNINLSSKRSSVLVYSNSGNTVSQKGLTADEFNKKAEADYAAFERSVKENLVKYGRTLRSLSANEVVILNINLGSHRNSQLPRSIQVMVSKSTIDEYARGSKSLQQVMDDVDIRKLKAALSSTSFGYREGVVRGRGVYEVADRPVPVVVGQN